VHSSNARLDGGDEPCAANRSYDKGVERDPDHEGEGDDGQAIARNQSIEEVQDWNQQVVGDVSDHVEETGGRDVVRPVCMNSCTQAAKPSVVFSWALAARLLMRSRM